MIALVFALLATITWTGGLLLLSEVMRRWPVGEAGTLARLLSALLLALWVILGKGAGWRRLLPSGRGRWLLLMGVIAIVINLCMYLGMRWTTATNAALLFRMDLLFVVLIGMAMGIERISVQGLAIAPLMFVGLVMILDVHHLSFAGHVRGDALIIVAAFTFAINAFVIRHILQRMDGEAVAAYNYLLSALGFAALAVIQGIHVPAAVRQDPWAWFWLIALGIGGAISLPLYYGALRRMAVWKLRVFMLLSPLLAAVADWLLWGQRLHGMQWWGAALLLAGALMLVLFEARVSRQQGERQPAGRLERSDPCPRPLDACAAR